jgi:hypothetical protein
MKITIKVESCQNSDGEDTTVEFTKDNVEYIEDFLHAMGRSLRATGFDFVSSLTAKSDDGTTFTGNF